MSRFLLSCLAMVACAPPPSGGAAPPQPPPRPPAPLAPAAGTPAPESIDRPGECQTLVGRINSAQEQTAALLDADEQLSSEAMWALANALYDLGKSLPELELRDPALRRYATEYAELAIRSGDAATAVAEAMETRDPDRSLEVQQELDVLSLTEQRLADEIDAECAPPPAP